jgi:hypothetical protein
VEIISFSAPARLKDLLRLRAAVRRLTVSAYVRELVLAQVPDPTADESLFLPPSGHDNEHSVHICTIAPSGGVTLCAEDDREPNLVV